MRPPSESALEPVAVPSGGRFVGRLRPPPSKSLTNRYLNLALLSPRPTVIERPLLADDTRFFLDALGALGFARGWRGERSVRLDPPARWPELAEIDCGASGTMARLLLAALTALPGRWRLDGRDRLRERPMGALIAALRHLGAGIRCLRREGYLPIEVEGGTLAGGVAELDAGESSQFLSALLMAAGCAQRPVEVRVRALTSAPYVELTLEAMAAFEIEVRRPAADRYLVRPAAGPAGTSEPRSLRVAGDDSAACYPAAAAALTGGRVDLVGLERGSAQGDRRFLELLAAMGARISWKEDGALRVEGRGPLESVRADLSAMPDQVPTLAALAPFARGTTKIRNVAHLRLKESDRLAAIADGLRRVGAQVELGSDRLEIPGTWASGTPPAGAVRIDSHRDHRIAMSFALLGLRRPGVSIADPGVVAKSYPEFWRHLLDGLER